MCFPVCSLHFMSAFAEFWLSYFESTLAWSLLLAACEQCLHKMGGQGAAMAVSHQANNPSVGYLVLTFITDDVST